MKVIGQNQLKTSSKPVYICIIVSIFAYAFNMSLLKSERIYILRVLLFLNFRRNSSIVAKSFKKEWIETLER